MTYGMLNTQALKGPTGASSGAGGHRDPWDVFRGIKTMEASQQGPEGYLQGKIKQFTPEQMQLYKQLFGYLGPESYLGRLAGGDESLFGEIEAPALRQFSGMQGNIASKFSGMGMGARRSTGHQLAQTSAAQDFAQQLQANRQSLQRQALLDMSNISSSLLGQRPYENYLVPEQMPWEEAMGLGLVLFEG